MFSLELVLTLVPGSMQLTYKKISGLNNLSKIYIIECISQGHRQKKGKQKQIKEILTFRSTVVFSLVLVPGPMQLDYEKVSGVNNSCGQNMYH